MTVNSYLSSLASNLVLSSDEKASINTSISTLEYRLELFFGSDIVEKFKFGSSTRDTILPRKADSNSDIDYMIVFNNCNNYQPQTYLNQLKRFAEKYYQTSEIHQSSPTIVLELNHIKFELVPAYKSGCGYYIPNKTGGWMYTDPNDINSNLTKANTKNGSKIKPVIRLLKHWNISKTYRHYESYSLEKKLISSLEYSYFSCTSYSDYVLAAFNALKSECIYGTTIYNKIDKAIKDIKEAVDDESKYPSLVEDEIKRVFPEV